MCPRCVEEGKGYEGKGKRVGQRERDELGQLG